MKIEQKKINPKENLFYFTPPLTLIGAFYASTKDEPTHQILQNLQSSGMAEELLLTSDFLYIKSLQTENLEDLSLLALAETDDYIATDYPLQMAESENIETKIKIILKIIVAPFLQRDGGDIEFVSYKSDVVTVRFLGKCQGCPYAKQTLKERVAKNLMRYLPQIEEVVLE